METLITVKPSELNEKLLSRIREFVGHADDSKITISIKKTKKAKKETAAQMRARINRAIEDVEKGKNLVAVTPSEFGQLVELLGKTA